MTHNITIFDLLTGAIKRTISCQDIDVQMQVMAGEGYINGTWPDDKYIVVNGIAIDKPAEPVIPPSLADVKKDKLAYLDTSYNAANLSDFSYKNMIFNADVVAQNNINATANYMNMFGTFPADWIGYWIAKDGSQLPMSEVDDFKSFYQAYTAAGVANITKFNTLKSQVILATTVDAVNAITW